MRDQDQPGAVVDSLFKCYRDLVELLRRNWNLDQLQLEAFPLLALTQRGQHAWIILRSSENFVAGLEVHAIQENLERLGSIARDRDLFAVAAEHFRQTRADRFALWLENLPHRVSGGVFLFPDVTNERLGHNARTGRNAAIVQI